jgi:transcriptional regulator GlxA family with amidase domain
LLEEHFREDVPLAHLANATGTSMYHLQRAFRRAWGLSPHEFQSQLRVYHARALLQVGKALTDVATEVGFFDQSHLNRQFKRILGITPGQYRHSIVSLR